MTTNNCSAGRVRWGLLALALTLAATGCTQVTGAGTKAGGEAPPIVLRIGTNDPQGRTASNQIEEFARQVEERADGSVVIEPVFEVGGTNTQGWDQLVARQVINGGLDGGMIPARAWDLLDVETLRALHTPFLVSSDELMNEIVGDDALARDLMSGLAEVGVTGLALVPEELRRLFVFEQTPVALTGLRDGIVRAPRSATTWALLEALGMKPTEAEFQDGFVAAESAYGIAHTLPKATAVIGNLTLFPKVNSLVVNSDRFDDLTEGQQKAIREAALATRDRAITANPNDMEGAADYCENGGTVVLVDDAELMAMKRAAEQVTHMLREDETTADLIDRLEALAQTPPSIKAQACTGQVEPPDEVTSSNLVAEGGDLPDGIYRVEFTDEYLRSQGLNAENIGYNRGVWTFVLEDGEWSLHQVASDTEDRQTNIYQVKGKDLYWRFYDGEPIAHVTWTVDAAGDLHFTWVGGPSGAEFHFGIPWRRVG